MKRCSAEPAAAAGAVGWTMSLTAASVISRALLGRVSYEHGAARLWPYLRADGPPTSSDDEAGEHPLNAAAPLRVPYEALPPPGHALRLVTASARRAHVAPPTWHYASRDERERATLERLRQLPPGNEDVVDATLGRLRLERQVAEALAALGMDQP